MYFAVLNSSTNVAFLSDTPAVATMIPQSRVFPASSGQADVSERGGHDDPPPLRGSGRGRLEGRRGERGRS